MSSTNATGASISNSSDRSDEATNGLDTLLRNANISGETAAELWHAVTAADRWRSATNDTTVRSDDATVHISNGIERKDDVTVQLSKKESEEHMAGMEEVYQEFRKRPITICAHFYDADAPLIDTKTKLRSDTNGTFKVIKMIHFIRHGQGFHNLLADIATESGITWRQFENNDTAVVTSTTASICTNKNPYMRPEVYDAPLTELGRKQAQQLHYEMVQNCTPIDRVYVSPHCRTLQTGMIAFQHFIHPTCVSTIPLIAHELVREESGVHVCDQRRNISWQRIEFPQYDFHSYCTSDVDPLFHPRTRETKFQVANRIYQFMEHLSKLEDANNIAVVSHSGWLHILFNAIVQNDCHPNLKKWFQTGEMRSVKVEFIVKC